MRRVLFIFGQLSDDDVEWLVAHGERTAIPAGEILIHEGVHSPNLYFLVDGRMSVDVKGVGHVAELGSGEVIGEMSFVDSSPPGATVTAREDCLLLGLNKEDALSHMKQDSDFASRFYKALAIFLSNRLRDTTLQMRGQKAVDNVDEDDREGQLDDAILKTVHLAAYRFNRLVEKVRE